MASRGTVPSKIRDLYTDAALTGGTLKGTKHFKNAVRKYQEVQNKYGKGQNYHLTGHSLGGMTTVASSQIPPFHLLKHGVEPTRFNP
ncbi:unnamed protein product, partial [Ectocarpus sp. 12 AP-2014]